MTAVQEHIARGADETERIAAVLARTLRPGDVVALDGELGSGKTSFVRGLAGGLECEGIVNSPTFVRMQRYEGDGGELVHIDAYRFEGEGDLAQLGWDELIDERRAIVAIEWASRVVNALPEHRVDVVLRHAEDGARVIRIRDRRHEQHGAVCRVCGQIMPAGATAAFCSDRCKGADLKRWLDGAYAIGSIPDDQDE